MKKLISTIMALTITCTSLAVMNAGAIALTFDRNSDRFAGYEELYHIEDGKDSHSVFTKIITNDDGSTYRDYIYVTHHDGAFQFNTYGEGATYDERITDILSSYGLECKARDVYGNGTGIYTYYGYMPDNFPYVREIYNKITEIVNVSSFDVRGSRYVSSGSGDIDFKSPTYYAYGIPENQIDSLAKYIEEKNLDFTLERGKLTSEADEYTVYNSYRCNLIPNYDIDFDEHLQIAADIANTLGIDIPILYEQSAETVVSGSGNIDVLNSIDGDANGDGEMNIADATAIVQAIGNKDKYGLTAQGEFNADLDGNGLTGADALAIQQKLVEMGTI